MSPVFRQGKYALHGVSHCSQTGRFQTKPQLEKFPTRPEKVIRPTKPAATRDHADNVPALLNVIEAESTAPSVPPMSAGEGNLSLHLKIKE